MMNYTMTQIAEGEMKFERRVKLLDNYVKRSTKNKPLILENGCLNYRYSHYEIVEYRDGEKVLLIYDDTHERAFFEISIKDLIENKVTWKKDSKYNTLYINVEF